jgi:acyl-CoA synthetase (AMP-forming)/AMP-acid ligase II
MLTHIAAAATMIVLQSMVYPKVVLDLMREHGATGLSGVPSTFALLAASPAARQYAFPGLRYIAQAGGPMSPKLAAEAQSIFPGAAVFIMYGQTEASARLSYLHPDDFAKKPGSIGKAIPGVTLKLLDKQGAPVKPGEVGEIVACGPNIMQGYWQDPAGTAQVLRKEGLWTGDLAKMDAEGFFYIVSRKSEMIKSGAHRIGPKEIEDIILEHPAVRETAVFGIEDGILGEAVAACVVTKQGGSCTAQELLLHCRQNLPAFKVPHRVLLVETLPKTPSGKVIKNELKKIVANRF